MLPVSAISVIKAMTFGKQVSLFKVISYMIFYQSAWATTAKCHSLCGLNNGHAFPHSSGDWTSTVTVPAPLVLERPLDLARALLPSRCPRVAFTCPEVKRQRSGVSPSSYQNVSPSGPGPALATSAHTKGPISKRCHAGG